MYIVSDKDWACDRCGKKHLTLDKNSQNFIYHTYNINNCGTTEAGSYTLCSDCLEKVFKFIRGEK